MTTPVRVIRIEPESANGLVKRFWLRAESPLRFLAGQWVDLHTPVGIGGYSLISPPEDDLYEIQLVIKVSDHVVATWMSRDCAVGAELQIAVGGTCFFSPGNDDSADNSDRIVTLVAGGLGINPHISIAQAALRCAAVVRVTLLYSCREEERLFINDIDLLQKEHPERFVFRLFLNSRIALDDIKQHAPQGEVFVCGPVSFAEAMMQCLNECQVPPTSIRHEKWW